MPHRGNTSHKETLKMTFTSDFSQAVRKRFDGYLNAIELFGLVVIGIATTVAIGHECWNMMGHRAVSLTDLLLMFLYLEVLAMVGKYFKSGQLPVKFPLYIAMVALARDLILGINKLSEGHMLAATGAILMLAIGVFIIRVGESKYPGRDDQDSAV